MRIAPILIASIAFAQSGKLPSPSVSLRGVGTPGQHRIEATDGTYGGFKGPASFTGSPVWALPAADGAGCFRSDGSGTLAVANCGEWVRNTGSGYLYPVVSTDDVRITNKLQLGDSSGSGSGLLWDLQAQVPNPAIGTVKALLRDNAGATVQEWERTFFGSPTNISRIDMSLEPATSSARKLGSSTRLWLETYSAAVYTQGLHSAGGSSQINFSNHLIPAVSGSQDVGDSSHRVGTIYVQNIDCTVSCGPVYFSRNSGSGYVYPTTATDSIQARKFHFEDNSGSASGLIWDLQAVNVTGGTDTLYFRDRSGVKVFEMERAFLGSATDIARLDMSLEPLTSSARKLGSSTRLWLETYSAAVYTQGIHSTGGSSQINLHDHLIPAGSAAQDIADSSHRIRKLWVQDIDCSGVCPSGTLPAVDTTSIVEGSSDATKEVRFEVDGLTASTVRVMTVPDNDQILAGRNVDNSFTAAQNSTVGFKSANAGGTAYVAGNNIEIHQQATGDHFTIKTTGTNAFNIVTPSSTLVQAWDFSTGTPTSTLAAEFLPSGTRDIGSGSFPWRATWANETVTQNLWPISAGYIGILGNLLPITDNAYSLGDVSHRSNGVFSYDGSFADDVTIGDALTVTGASTLTGAVTHGSTTSLAGNVTFASDNAYNIGTTSGGRPANIGAVSSIILYHTTNSSIYRTYIDTAGTTWNNSSGTQKASVNNTSGAIWATGGFYAGSGVTQVVDSNSRWVGADLFFAADNTYNIGNGGGGSRPANISATATINLYNNGTSTLRTQIATSSTTWRDSSGNIKASVNTTSGAVFGTSFFVGAGVTAGFSGTFSVRDNGGGTDCTITVIGGIVTGGNC